MDAKVSPIPTPVKEVVIDLPQIFTDSTTSSDPQNQSSSCSSSSPTSTLQKWLHHYQTIFKLILTNCQVGYFRISLSLCAQALLWKTLIHFTHDNDDNYHSFDHFAHFLPSTATVLLWSLALFTLLTTSFIYILKSIFFFSIVKTEFHHHVGINYFFAPWMSSLLLLQASPFSPNVVVSSHYLIIYYRLFWWILVVPVIVLDIKLYGDWFTKGKRFLSRVATPASQLSVIANLVAARASMVMGWKEEALCLFSLGMVHYLVLFVTLYQRLPGGDGLPMMLRPVFFLFIATPSVASLCWAEINGGEFDVAAKMMFFLSLFLFISLVCRPTLFKKSMSNFSVAWWSYCFSLTLLALASIEYAKEVKAGASHVIMLLLSVLSILIMFVLLVFTVINANKLLLRPSNTNKHDDIDSSINRCSSDDSGNSTKSSAQSPTGLQSQDSIEN